VNSEPQHFSPEQWADFVRQIADPREAASMREHLNGGCDLCAKTVHWLQTVVQTVADSVCDDPPPALVEKAKAVFHPRRREQSANWIEGLETMVATLALVSSGDWLPQGVRSGGSTGQRLLYRAGIYAIDLTMDQAAQFGEVAEIVGQIVDEQQLDAGTLNGVLVQLWIGDRVFGETETNQYGEFVLQRPTSKAAVLRFLLTGQGKQIELRIRNEKEQSR
jgi:hypothetical protein